ncbi:zf-RING_2 domain-containing protein [Cephalotus follicularis]|uniref:RING-type E3 ubiquitin transferase n=1 Tax=Cephalotus follicularis TaxID=3775 RepID=A0A1Q3AZW2_CEPFO|nr:zf-RING_2 domain-containing protein [Cephalotus follicularis]
MQGQRGTVGSMPETLNFDHGSASSNAAMDQQICWNNIRNPVDNRFPDYLLSPDDTNIAYMSSISHEQQNFNRWSLGETSSSGTLNGGGHDEQKVEHVWSSSVSDCGGVGPRLEERHYEPTNILSLDTVNANPAVQSTNSDTIPQNLNLNTGFMGHGGNSCQGTERPIIQKSGGSDIERVLPPSGSESFRFPSESGEYMVEENDDRLGCSFEGRRASCKRKALDGNVGQSSMDGSSSYLQNAGSSSWPAFPAHHNAGSSLSLSAPSEQVSPRLGLGVRSLASNSGPDSVAVASADSSQRNYRVRINSSNQQETLPPPLFSMGNAMRHSSVSSSQQSSRLLPSDHSLNLRSASVVDNVSPPTQPVVIHIPAMSRNVQPFRWNGGSNSRTIISSSSNISGENVVPLEEARSRSISRNALEHSMFIPAPELRNLVRNQVNRNLSVGNIIPGNSASTSRTGSSSSVHPSSPGWVPHPNPSSHYPRRFSELVRRSLVSNLGTESGGESNDNSSGSSGPPASAEEIVLSSGSGNQRRHHSFPRSTSRMERQGDGALGVPHSMRALASATEGRNRLVVSEIRNVLDLMRRGESLRFEDVMVLDQSVYFGVADIHDRHRDMRLDVDNMSYEELLALEERIGNVSTGLTEETILSRLERRICCIINGAEHEEEPCSICREEYNDGEELGTLDCGHDFHADCVKQWLTHKNLCPICKETGLAM